MVSDVTTNAEPERDQEGGPGLDVAAFELLFKEQFLPLCAYSQFHFGQDADAAKDIVQAGFLKLWEIRTIIEPAQSAKSYLYKIVANKCLDKIKHEKIKHRSETRLLRDQFLTQSNPSPDNTDFKLLSTRIDQAVAALPGQMKKIFELSRHEKLKYAEIAAKLNISIKTVETQMSRAMAKLRVSLQEFLVFIPAILLALTGWLKK